MPSSAPSLRICNCFPAKLVSYYLLQWGSFFHSKVDNVCLGLLLVQLFQHENATKRILDGRVGRRCPGSDAHDNVLVHILDKGLCNNLSVHISMCYGIVSSDTFGPVNVKCTDSSMNGNLQQVCCIGGVKATHDENKIQTKIFGVFD